MGVRVRRLFRRTVEEPTPRRSGPKPPEGINANHPLMVGARPLIATGAPLVVSWSPKSACTQVLLWFLYQEGLLEASQYFSRWPHDFRGRVYYHSATYHHAARQVAKSNGAGFTLLRVTRDPTARFVSIFRHVLRRKVMRAEINAFVGRDIGVEGMSIAELGAFLDGKPLLLPSPMDQHLCAQTHPAWAMNFERVITLNVDTDDLFRGLNGLAKDLDLRQTPFNQLPAFEMIAERHHATDTTSPERDILNAVLSVSDNSTFPIKALRADARVQALATRLYAVDVAETASGDSLGRLKFE